MDLGKYYSGDESSLSLYQRWIELQNQKGSRKNLMRRASEFFEPDDNVITGEQRLSSPDGGETREFLDTTTLEVLEDYKTTVMGVSYSSEKRWFTIEHTKIDPLSDLQKVLNERAKIVHRNMRRTNYYKHIPLFESDVVGHGHGLFVINKDKKRFAMCYTVTPYNIIFDKDLYGEVVGIYFENSYTVKDLFVEFPAIDAMKNEDKVKNQSLNKEYKILLIFHELTDNYVLTDEDKQKRDEGYNYVLKHLFRDSTDLLIREGKARTLMHAMNPKYYKVPGVLATRDKVTRKDGYGHGKYRDLLPKARMLNALAGGELEIVHQQYNPPLMMIPDIYEKTKGIFRAGFTYVTDALGIGSKLSETKNPVEMLQTKGDLKAVDAIHRKHQEEVVNSLPTASNIYKTARQSVDEISTRMAQEEKKLEPLRTCFVQEGLSKHIRKFYDICEQEGLFDTDKARLPEGIEKEIDISATSDELIFDGFMLQKFREKKANAVIRALNKSAPIASVAPQEIGRLSGKIALKSIWAGEGVMDVLKSDAQFQEEQRRTIAAADRREDREDQLALSKNVDSMAKISEVMKLYEGRDSE